MLTETTSRRTGDLTTRIVLLALGALALGAAIYVIARSHMERTATAELYFNPDAAYRGNSALSHASEPAVAAAQWMLTDATIPDVLREASQPFPDAAADEFRKHIIFEERSLETLRVRYRDPDPRRASAVANAVATALVEWSPPVTPAPALPARAPAAAIQTAPAVALPAAPKQDALAAAYSTLAENEGSLAGIDTRLEVLAGRPPSVPLDPVPLTAAQEERRRSLQTQLAAAHRNLDDLRTRTGDNGAEIGTTEHTIGDLQQELGAFPPSTREALENREAQAAQLRRQRGEVARKIAAENRKIARLRAHPPKETAPVAAPPVQVVSAPALAFRPPAPEWQNPFRIARSARAVPRFLAQPVRLAGEMAAVFFAVGLGGILYLGRGPQAADAAEPAGPPVLVAPTPVAQQIAGPEPVAEASAQPAIAIEPANVQEPVEAEAEDAWDVGAREPEITEELASIDTVVPRSGETARDRISAEPITTTAELDDRLEPAHPIYAARPSLGGPEAAKEPPRDEVADRMPEASLPQAAPAVPLMAAVESTHADGRSTGMPSETNIRRSSIADPGENDAEWSERVLEALTRTLVAKESRIREARSNRAANAAAGRSAGNEQEPGGARSGESGEK